MRRAVVFVAREGQPGPNRRPEYHPGDVPEDRDGSLRQAKPEQHHPPDPRNSAQHEGTVRALWSAKRGPGREASQLTDQYPNKGQPKPIPPPAPAAIAQQVES